MIRFLQGNLFEAPADALVNTVNELGIMGKGIALMFRDAFPENTRAYEAASKAKEIRVGHMFVTRNTTLMGPRWIINFPTKKHWRQPSQLSWIKDGLVDLVRVIRENEIHSIAIPPLGCGNGGLDWNDVRSEIETAMAQVPDVDVLVYEPTSAYHTTPKREGVNELTPARALIAELVRRYSVLGMECTYLEVQKLAWFLDRAIARLGLRDPLKLQFVAHKYGPYAERLRHLLDGLDGSYLHSEKRLADAGPSDLIWFEDERREAVGAYLCSDAARPYVAALDETTHLINGFESPLGMELLATVDWLRADGRDVSSLDKVKSEIAQWPGGEASAHRKQAIFDDRLLMLGMERLAADLRL